MSSVAAGRSRYDVSTDTQSGLAGGPRPRHGAAASPLSTSTSTSSASTNVRSCSWTLTNGRLRPAVGDRLVGEGAGVDHSPFRVLVRVTIEVDRPVAAELPHPVDHPDVELGAVPVADQLRSVRVDGGGDRRRRGSRRPGSSSSRRLEAASARRSATGRACRRRRRTRRTPSARPTGGRRSAHRGPRRHRTSGPIRRVGLPVGGDAGEHVDERLGRRHEPVVRASRPTSARARAPAAAARSARRRGAAG